MRRNSLMLVIAIISITIGSALTGCTSTPEIRYITDPLPLPARPVLPSIGAAELSCLPKDVYERVMLRDLGRRQYAEDLEAIIRSTHPPQEKDE